ncbi:amino acid permease [Rubrivirga marina]|uniref:Amino acid transporter n=1 Tax=Rubrivirga marina TaxID=1196024 RepID=A0A271J141_9BACT|nr:amino acid permease [Rubrivirga marina]PAP76449.1 amino acid transporter [Rubrivirga marina]
MTDDAPRLKKELKLFDVYAICTGAMFSAEFFLLPGLAMAYAGPSVVLAYFVSGLLVLPAMFSQAELATAMPRAGGTYYFIDRALGPLVGTVGGLGTWLSLVFKSAFALIGVGAYLVLFMDLPIKPVAVGMTVAFTVLNIFGAKETSGLQRFLVTTLVLVLTVFVLQGVVEIVSSDVGAVAEAKFTPFMPFGVGSLFATIGLVFAAYAGLTKVASVAEEVENPDRNIPLGMMLSLGTAVLVYTVGVYILVAVLDPVALMEDLTPVATAARDILDWIPTPGGLPESTGVLLITIAALAAFASTGNAGILSASRYPLAMARDRLITRRLGAIGRFHTPAPAILVTGGAMVLCILLLDVEGVAKLASAFNLLVFGLINLAVIVMRESHIPSYVPGFRTPLYPWMQIVGILTSVLLIVQMGAVAIGFTGGVSVLCVVWYVYYVRRNVEVEREGAIYHLFARLGQRRYEPLDSELRTILKEKGLRDETPFEHLVTHAEVLDLDERRDYEDVVREASGLLAADVPLSVDDLSEGFLEGARYGSTPVSQGAALPHQRLPGLADPRLVMVRCRPGLSIPVDTTGDERPDADARVHAVFFLLSPEEPPGRHLRTLANIASRIDEADFMDQWLAAENEQDLKEVLLRNDRFLALHLRPTDATAPLIGRALKDLRLPTGVLVALIHRDGHSTVPSGGTVLEAGDRITFIGDTQSIERVHARYSS